MIAPTAARCGASAEGVSFAGVSLVVAVSPLVITLVISLCATLEDTGYETAAGWP